MDRPTSMDPRRAARSCGGARCVQLSVDMREHRPTLEALAQSRHMSQAAMLRMAFAEWLELRAPAETRSAVEPSSAAPGKTLAPQHFVMVRLRMPTGSADKLAREADAAGMFRGLYVAQLLDGSPPMPAPADLTENRRALVSSTSTLAALCCDIHALERSVGWSQSEACREVTDLMDAAIRRHLNLASSLLAAMTTKRRPRALRADPR